MNTLFVSSISKFNDVTMNTLEVSNNSKFNNVTMNTLFVSNNSKFNDVIINKLIVSELNYIINDNLDNSRPTTLGLEFINKLQPTDYMYNNIYHHSFLIENIKNTLYNLNENYNDAILKKDNNQYIFSILELIGPIIKAIQELSLMVL